MQIREIGQVGQVAALGNDSVPSAAQLPVGVVGLGPVVLASADNGLAAPRAGLRGARASMLRVAAKTQDADLLDQARAHFSRDRAEVVTAFQRSHPELSQTTLDEIGDEWVARSVQRYSALLGGRNDGLNELNPSVLLLTIAYEARRSPTDPIRVLAEAHQAKLIAQFSRGGVSSEEATFQVRTTGARMSRSTAGWEAELQRTFLRV